jgi:cobaltochelatase CobN
MLKATFVFTHVSLARVWDRAAEILREQGIELRVVGQMSPLDWEDFVETSVRPAGAVYLDITRHFGSFDLLVEAARQVKLALPGGIETQAAMPDFDRAALAAVQSYLRVGRAEDLAHAVAWMLHRAGLTAKMPPPPGDPVLFGVHHPDADRIWNDAADYLAWADARAPERRDAPAVGLIFDRAGWLNGETASVDLCVSRLEAAGAVPVPVFCDWDVGVGYGAPDHPLRRLFEQCGPRLAALWNAGAIYGREESGEGGPFACHGVPVFQLMRNWHSSIEEWRQSGEGLNPISVSFSLTRPEIMGMSDPTLVSCSRPGPDGSMERKTVEPIAEQVERLAGRTMAWAALQRKPNAEKKVAILLHNPPCKGLEATIGNAGSLDALQSVVEVLRRLAAEGYAVSEIPADGEALLKLILARKAISEFRWTNVEEIVAKGGMIAEIDEATYRRDFDRLPVEVRRAVDEAWGAFPAKSMVRNPDGPRPTLAISGLRFGNVLVMTDPKRGCWGPKCDGEVCRILHDPDIPPPHHWLATFWYLQRNVDALVMMGAEGPMEFLPGKRVGLSESCYPNISLGNLPVIYPYVMNNTGEGLIAKRRARVVLVDHLSAPVARADAIGKRWDDLAELHRQYLHADGMSRSRKRELAEDLRTELSSLGLLAEGADAATFDQALEALPRRLTAMRNRTLQAGLHTLGRVPDAERTAMYVAEARGIENRVLDGARLTSALAACGDEMDALIGALSGRFVKPGPSGHLSRGKIETLPTGRNFYGIDLSLLPTRAACEVGARMGEKLLDAYLADEGKFPETIGITLWSIDAFQADGELASQILWLMGCKPRYDAGGKVGGVDVVPLDEMVRRMPDGTARPRPRIDVVVQMSSVVRDTLPGIYALFDKAVAAVSELDEPADRNFVRAHVRARVAELRASLADATDDSLKRLASYRCFSSGDGAYGSGVGLALDASAWEDDADLAEVLVNTSGQAFGADGRAAEMPAATLMREYAGLVGRMDMSYQRAASASTDLLATGCYVGIQGGSAAAKRGLGGGSMRLYWGDTHSSAEGEVRTLKEEITLSLASTLVNRDWLEEVKTRGYPGASEVGNRANHLFAWSATTHEVDKAQFDGVHDMYVSNPENRAWLKETNIYALEELTRRLLEAHARGLWAADGRRLEELRAAVLEIEGDIEESMGSVKGEFQGSSVDIKTRAAVKEWDYEFRAK